MWTTSRPVEFVEKKLNIILDSWQKCYIEAKGSTAARAGRQSGKSFAQSIRTAIFALKYKGVKRTVIDEMDTIIITAGFERQAYELYMKIRRIIEFIAPHMIKGRPTMEKIELQNHVRILCLPGGRDGAGVRCFNVIRLVVDEAHYVPDEVYNAIEPMLATTGGDMDLLSTPKGNIGKFYDAFQEGSGFTTFHVTSEQCPRIPKEFLAAKKLSLTKIQYAQEYLAEFQDALQQFFPAKLVDPLLTLDPEKPKEFGRYYEGMDIAGWGKDETSFVMMEMMKNNRMEMRNLETTQETGIRQTITKMRERQKEWNTKEVIIDSGAGGGGGAIFDLLIDDRQFRRRIVGINNSSKAITHDKSRSRKLIKEDLYNNLKRMMEMGEVKLLKNEDLRRSLLSIQFEWTSDNNFRIFGNYSHITEGLIRACWAVKSKKLNIMVFC